MKITVDVPDVYAKGIALARAQFNASLPPTVKSVDGKTDIPNPALIAADEDYFSSRAISMAQSWAEMFGVTPVAQDKAKADFLAKVDPDKRAALDAAITAELSK